jgi:hypothetical protein
LAKALIPKGAGGTRVIVDEAAISIFLQQNKPVRDLLVSTAQAVASEAQATASDAENGPGGTITGYASAGFSVEWESRGGKRPRVNIVSNADPETTTRAHFYTQRRDGVAHLRAALYNAS